MNVKNWTNPRITKLWLAHFLCIQNLSHMWPLYDVYEQCNVMQCNVGCNWGGFFCPGAQGGGIHESINKPLFKVEFVLIQPLKYTLLIKIKPPHHIILKHLINITMSPPAGKPVLEGRYPSHVTSRTAQLSTKPPKTKVNKTGYMRVLSSLQPFKDI